MNFLNLGTPAERLEQVLTAALELRRANWPHEGFLYRGGGDLLLQHGKFYTGRTLPPEYLHHFGNPGECFENALKAAEADPSLSYVEGVYSVGSDHPTPHAWCLDPGGELLEVTFPSQPELIAQGRMAGTGMPVMTPEHWAYYGAVFRPEYVRALIAAQDGNYGIFDRPSHDMLTRIPGDSVDEWRSDWPVLRVRYNPDRKEP